MYLSDFEGKRVENYFMILKGVSPFYAKLSSDGVCMLIHTKQYVLLYNTAKYIKQILLNREAADDSLQCLEQTYTSCIAGSQKSDLAENFSANTIHDIHGHAGI